MFRRFGGALAAGILVVAPTSAWALSAQCTSINNNQIAPGAGTNAPATLNGTYAIGSPGFTGEQLTSTNYSDFNKAFAPGEVITYSWTRNSGTGYAHVTLQEQTGFTLRAGSVENGAGASGSGSITIGAANDTFSIATTNYTIDTANGVTNGGQDARANTSISFTISCSAPAPSFNFSLTHSGTPTQGSTFTLLPTLTNTGAAATSGNVTLTSTLPTGLTLSSYSGTNWNCTGTGTVNVSCTFSGTIGIGASNNALQLVTAVASNSATSRTVSINASGGGSSNSPTANDTIVMLPTITSIAPTAGPSAGGTSVVITGTNLFGTSGATGVRFGATNATGYTVNSNTQITATSPANSVGTYDVTVTNGGNTSATSAADQYTYVAAPTVTAISPTAGPTGGGTTVVITGTGFSAANPTGAVKFGATNATYTINSNTQITATSPANSAGTYDITVATTGGTSATSAADQFTYVAAPTVTSISPTAGPTGGGTTVIITGTGFSAANPTGAVKFGATNATYTINSNTQITATSPANSAGTYDVTVTTVGGTSATSAADQFTYVPAPTVTSISPTSGPGSGGTTVTITGTNFSGTTGVTFGGTAATGWTVLSGTTITATAPAGTGTVDIRVTTVGGTSATSAADQFTYIPAPTVTSISPTAGPTGGGTSVTITGTNFTGATAVTFGATAATGWTFNSATSITATAPAGAAGTVDIRVTTPGGTSATSAADQYTYVAAPTVTSISPTAGPLGGGTTVVITGTGFSAASPTGAVKFGATNATYTINSNTQITATSPANSAGTYDVTVTTVGGTSATSAADQFTYVPAPTVTSITPTAGPTSGGTTVIITGTNFSGATAVTFGGTAATGMVVNSGTQITATSPANAAGTYDVRVTTVGGTSATSAADQFTYVAAPVVTSISPHGGPTAGGTSVTITGTGFSGATAVTFGGTAATGWTVLSGTTITATSPAGAAGTVDVRITTTGGTSATSASDQFSYIAPVTISPASGALPGGTANAAYSQTFTASGGTPAYSFSSTGTLPSGLTLSAGGVLSGTPTASGTYNFTIDVSDNSAATAGTAFTASEAYSITISKSGQTINFGALSNASLSASPLTLSATATSGLTVSFTSTTTGVCTVSGTTLTLLTTGTCSIDANQAGDTAYDAAPTVTQSFTVTPATLTITPAAATGLKVGASYSQANTAAGGLTPYVYSLAAGAFVPGTSVDSSTGVVSGTPTVAGSFSYIVRVTDAQPVFADTSVTTVNIAKGDQALSFTSTAPGATVGGTPYTVTAASYVASTSTPTNLGVALTIDPSASSVCSISGNTVSFNATGTCVINANQAGDSNWNPATQVQQSFTVGAAGAITTSVSFSPSSLGVGSTGTTTITFTNPNISNSPNVAPLFSSSALLVRSGSVGGSCGATGSDAGANFQLNAFSIPSGSCTVTLDYTGSTAGASSGQVLGGFTPSGYPSTPAVQGNALSVVPTVTGVSPNSGPVSQVVTVSGTGFSTTPGNNTVHFGAGTGTVTGASSTSLTVTAPATGTGTVSVTVTVNGQTSTSSGSFTFIAPPVAANKPGVAVPYNSPGTAIDLSSSISGGPHGSIAIGTAVQHGTTTIAGDVVTYTPTAGYFGADSFTYTATGAGGTSNVATVSITVATPVAPVAADKAAAVPYNSAGTAIGLSSSITGVHGSIAIGSAPSHGSVSVAGDVVTYTPTANYYGADSFTYTATGPGGTSPPATVTVTVGNPPAPVAADKNGVAVPYASTGTAIDLSTSITGVRSSIAIGTAPAHGTVTIAGEVVTYTPAATYYGADSFTYTATGPGGTSAPATVNLTVAIPPAPVTADKPGVAVPYASTGTAIDLSGSITGVRASIAIGAAPAHGTVTIAGEVVTYTPTATYYGADSFTYTATGPGGTSNVSTVGVTVATPAAPVAANKSGVAVPYASTSTAIDLSPSISGVHGSIAIGTAPAHGTVTIAGDVVTYTPAATYYGADSFTYTATGPGGTSAPATVSLTVGLPPAPVAADKSGVAVPYASNGTAIDLSGSITGVHASIAIGTAPAHGTVTIAGDVVTYTPAATYYGADSFTYTATGPGGTSAPATVTLTVATPAAPTAANKSGVTVAYDSAGTAIDLAPSVSGVHSTLTVATAPTHGTTTVNGDVVTYTPTAGYYGADSFTYTVTGPGGTSAAATVSLTVATPPPPAAAPGTGSVAGSTTTAGTSVSINLSALVTGVYDTIQIASQPQHGTVTLSAVAGPSLNPTAAAPASPYIAVYTPAPNYAGTDSFTFTATGPGGTSSPATVTITVVGQVPVAVAKVANTGDGQMVSVMLTDGAIRGPFTGATVVSVSPASSASTAIVATGNGGYRLDVTPNNRFGGQIVVTYTLSNIFGASAPSTVTLTVQARPDPRNDPNVGAISDAQSEATRRFARAQVSNFMRRTEQLHNGGGQAGLAMGMTLNARDGTMGMRQRPDDKNWGLAITDRMRGSGEDPAIGRFANNPQSPLSRPDQLGYGRAIGPVGDGTPVAGASKKTADTNEDGTRRTGSVATWAGGAIDIGTRDKTTDRTKVTATTAGLSAGADVKLADGIVVGLGGGYGNDLSRIGTAAQVRGTSTLYAAYASLQPADGTFIDGVIGRGKLDFTTRRLAAAVDATARGSRDGSYTVAAISLGIDRNGGGALQWSLYGRGEYMDADLDAYAESGAGRYNLRFDAREVRSITGTIGGRIEYRQKLGFGSVTPRVRAEWNHEFADVDAQWLDYADIPGAAAYALTGNGWKREQLQLSLGARFDILKGGWSFDFETGLRTGQGEKAGTLQIRITKTF